MAPWSQVYDPLGNSVLSTLVCAIPVLVLLGGLGIFRIKAHYAAIAGLVTALVIALGVLGMPAQLAAGASFFGALFALTTICWIIVNLIFLYRMTVKSGLFQVLQDSVGGITNDRRLQLILIAFCFGAFFEGAAGGGTPVAVTGAILIGLGFSPLAASGLSLIANTAPVAFGGMGTPILVLNSVTQNTPEYLLTLSAMVGRQLPFFSVIVPFWIVLAFCGVRGTWQVWPAVLVAGASFAIPQFLISNYHGPWLVDMVSAMISMVVLALFLRYVWRPTHVMLDASGIAGSVSYAEAQANNRQHGHPREQVVRAWMPWVILTVVLAIWGIPWVKEHVLNQVAYWDWKIPWLHQLVERVAPAVDTPRKEAAVWRWGALQATGTAIFLSAIVSGLLMGFKPREQAKMWLETVGIMKFSILTIVCMLALGYTTRFSGMDATLGLAFAKTGWLYPFFGTLIGWIGVALTGTDAASNALFGSQQVITANKLNLNPTLMAAANSSGGVMGKMIDAQSIVVASVATNYVGKEGVILRFVFWHSISLAALVGVLVMLQAYLHPFSAMVLK